MATITRPTIEMLDSEMARLVDPDPPVLAVGQEFTFTEGPVWLPQSNALLFSDIPGDTIYRWREGEGLGIWRRPSRHANGNTADAQGRVITCEHGSRRLTRTQTNGEVTVLAQSHGGRRLNSPNDVVVKRDGTIWFTDPPYGIDPAKQEQPACFVFRLDPGGTEPLAVAADLSRPNGLCFSPDESLLYVANSDNAVHHIRRFEVRADNTLEDDGIFAVINPGVPDGMRIDAAGRLYSTAGDGVHVYHPDGRLLGKILTPQTAANCAFGGEDLSQLFITATRAVWRITLLAAGPR